MSPNLPLRGVRVHLSGSVPEGANPEVEKQIGDFVRQFSSALFREGGTLVHGSHPTLIPALKDAATPVVAAGGLRDTLTLVRAHGYAQTPEQLAEIDEQRQWAVVQIIPSKRGNVNESLVPMREWMAERCDVVVAVGGKWYQSTSKERAGLPLEIEEMLRRGKPGFLVGGFGGAVEGYWADDPTLDARLRNGLTTGINGKVATSTDANWIVKTIISQLKRLPLARGNVNSGSRFRILALDGGGVRGAFTAAVLTQWAARMGGDRSDLIRHFDLVAGTSTGSILAIGLGLGMTPQRILDFYQTESANIFPRVGWFHQVVGSKHALENLKKALTIAFGQKSLSQDSCCRLVIPTIRAKNGIAEILRTDHAKDKLGTTKYTAVEAAMASAAAPTYFDPAEVANPIAAELFVDGGLWANSPILPAIAEAVGPLGVPLDRIDVLSIGTLETREDFTKQLGGGLKDWAPNISNLFFAAQESGSSMLATELVSGARHYRVNSPMPGTIAMDDPKAIDQLAELGRDTGKDTFEVVKSRFLDGIHVADWRG
jgi:hypothetical protein